MCKCTNGDRDSRSSARASSRDRLAAARELRAGAHITLTLQSDPHPPDRVEKITLREDVPRVSDQRDQQLTGFGFESDRRPVRGGAR
jgi:hypothetical protein